MNVAMLWNTSAAVAKAIPAWPAASRNRELPLGAGQRRSRDHSLRSRVEQFLEIVLFFGRTTTIKMMMIAIAYPGHVSLELQKPSLAGGSRPARLLLLLSKRGTAAA